jgi:hypothetical protein
VEAESLLAIVLLPVDDGVDIATVEEGESEKRRRLKATKFERGDDYQLKHVNKAMCWPRAARFMGGTTSQSAGTQQSRNLSNGRWEVQVLVLRGGVEPRNRIGVEWRAWWFFETPIGRGSVGCRVGFAVGCGRIERDREGETMRLPG